MTKPIILILMTSFILCMNVNAQRIELDSGIALVGNVVPFDSTKHKIERCNFSGYTGVCLIDGKPFFGQDQGNFLPRNQLVELTFTINGVQSKLDVSQMYNPNYENKIYKDRFTIRRFGIVYELTGWFSDGAGTYLVRWKIIQGKSIRTAILDGEQGFCLDE